jgi:hypothetical protein
MKRTVRRLASSNEKTNHAEGVLVSPLPFPHPPKKKIHNLPKTPPHQDLLITNTLTQVQIPLAFPIYESTEWTS